MNREPQVVYTYFKESITNNSFPQLTRVTSPKFRGLPAVFIPPHQYSSLIAQYSPNIKNGRLLTTLIFQDYLNILRRIFS